jgi:phage protein D
MVVDRDIGSADMAAIMLANQDDIYSPLTLGSGVEIKVGSNPASIYVGEIVGLEPIYKGGDKSKILIRAMNKLHRLLRKRKSVTFTDKSDQQILSQVVGDAGLTLQWKHDKTITYKHVYQHNQTDLEFLRTRAARMGCHVWCVGTDVFVKQPELQGDGKPKLNVDDATEPALRMFAPRLSSAGLVKKVTVKGWNPETKELISGDVSVTPSKLGKQTGVDAGGPMADEETFTVDHPIWDKAEAMALAKARLQEASLTYITGVAEVTGTPAYDLGKLVSITANAKNTEDPFNGLYYIMGLSHRFNASHAKGESAYVTVLRLARDAQKPAAK